MYNVSMYHSFTTLFYCASYFFNASKSLNQLSFFSINLLYISFNFRNIYKVVFIWFSYHSGHFRQFRAYPMAAHKMTKKGETLHWGQILLSERFNGSFGFIVLLKIYKSISHSVIKLIITIFIDM